MTDIGSRAPRRRPGYAWLAVVPVAAAGAIAMFIASQPALAETAPVGLGTAGSFAVLAGTTVTNTGPSTISGDLGVSPGTAVTGFPPGTVSNGTIHSADGVAAGAQSDLTTAYNDAAGRSPTASVPGFIGAGQTLAPGVYKASSSLDVGGSLTLDAGGDPNAVFIFQAPRRSLLTRPAASSSPTAPRPATCSGRWAVPPPVFVTVAAPITPKFAAVPSGTGAAVAAAPADPAAPISKAAAATARTAIPASRNGAFGWDLGAAQADGHQ
jgi:Ice-binding-like